MKTIKNIGLFLMLVALTYTTKAQTDALPVVSYHCQTFSCENTTAETTIFLDTLYAGTWTNEAYVTPNMKIFSKNNSGSTATLTLRVKVDGQTVVTLNNANVLSNIGEGWNWRGITMARSGDTVAMFPSAGTTLSSTVALSQPFISTNSFVNTTLTNLNFAQDKVIEVTAQWSIASPQIYFRAKEGKVVFTP